MPNYPHHLRGFDYRGLQRYFLTFCCYQRRPHFSDPMICDQVLGHLRLTAARDGYSVPAYTFMPDHLHLLVAGQRDDADLRRWIAAFKQVCGFHFARATGERLWQRYGFERVLRSEEATASVVRYIVENPVRRKLATSPEQYPWTGSLTMTREALWELAASATDRWAG